MKLRLVPQLFEKKTVYREFQESLTNDLVTGTASEADTWTLFSGTITNCTEQKKKFGVSCVTHYS